MRRSLIWRIAVPFIILILLSVGGVSLYFSNYIEQQYLSTTHENLATSAHLLAYDTSSRIIAGSSYEELTPMVEEYAAQTDTRVTLIRTDGVVIADSLADPRTMENHLARPEVRDALLNKEGIEIRFSDTLKKRFYYLAIPITSEGKLIAVARLARELTEIEVAVNALRNRILSIGGLIILMTIILAFFVARSALQPLHDLSSNVQRLINGEKDIELSSDRRDEIGQLTRSIADVADQLSIQVEDFREERGKLQAVLHHMTDAVLIVNSAGKVILANPAADRLFNIPTEQTLGKSLVEVVRQHQFVELWRQSQVTHKQQVSTLETSPERLFVQGIATPLESSLPGGTLLVFQDLTLIRRLETVRRDFISNVSHELRTPLASLKALAETLQTSALDDPPAAKRFLSRMETEIDNLTQMVRESLDLSRIESGKVPLARRPVNPITLAKYAVERMQMQADRGGLTIHLDDTELLPDVMVDSERIEAVLVNLLHNAIKFTPPGGNIKVKLSQKQDAVLFSVQDNGVGIKPEELHRIFERFYKADQSRSGGGTGLGLSIARHTVEAHLGKIWAESNPDEGSTFFFTLPTA